MFVGYVGPTDREYAEICGSRLRNAGLQVIVSENEYATEYIRNKLKKELNNAAIFVAIHSKSSLDSAWLHQELGYFLGKTRGSTRNLHIVSSKVVQVNNPRKMGLLANYECLPIRRLRRSKACFSKPEMSEANEHTLETALDRITIKLLDEGVIKGRLHATAHSERTVRMRWELPCCGVMRTIPIPIRRMHSAHSLCILSNARCPECGEFYGIDRLSWDLIPTDDENAAAAAIPDRTTILELDMSDREIALFQESLIRDGYLRPPKGSHNEAKGG